MQTGTLHAITLSHSALGALVVIAAVVDWRTQRIPNWLTFGGIAVGFAASLLPGGIGGVDSVTGAGTALVLLLPLYLLRATGAGDVKLMSAVGSFLGLPDVLFALVLTMLAGGLCSVAFAAWNRNVSRMVLNARDLLELTAIAATHGQRPAAAIASVGKLPYAVCVCAGTFAWLAWAHLRT